MTGLVLFCSCSTLAALAGVLAGAWLTGDRVKADEVLTNPRLWCALGRERTERQLAEMAEAAANGRADRLLERAETAERELALAQRALDGAA